MLCAATLALLSAPASGEEGVPASRLGADVSKTGTVTLGYFGKPGSAVFYYERVGSVLKPLGLLPIGATGFVSLKDAVAWRCDRVERRFESIEVQPDGARALGSADVRTGSCAQRFRLSAPARVRLHKRARVRIADRWNVGAIRTKLCITPPGAHTACRSLQFLPAVEVRSRLFRATENGRWKVDLRVRGHHIRTSVRVGPGVTVKPAPSVLMTGDSTMEGIDNFVADRLGESARVHSDARPGENLSNGTRWLTRAANQANRVKPKTTVVSLGAGEGNTMQTPGGASVVCCDARWVLEYQRRVSTMMNSYRRGGKGKILWLTLATPRSKLLADITAKVNRAILAAAQGRPGVKVLRVDLALTPDRYRDVIHFRGQDVRVRSVDGVHLSAAGTSIVAGFVEKALRKGW